jgi:hypothetical protein
MMAPPAMGLGGLRKARYAPAMGLGGLRKARDVGFSPLEIKQPFAGFGKVKSSIVVASTQTGTQWLVPDDATKTVPEHWVLERTSRFVGHTKASVVAERVAKCLQQRSVSSCFNGPKAKAKCYTDDMVEFRLKLYSGRGEYCHGVIIEVQKRCGSSVFFKRECIAVLDAAEGIRNGTTPTFFKPHRVCDLGISLDNSVRADATAALEAATHMIQEDSEESNLRGLESLVHLTDSTKSSKEVASFVSKELVTSDDYADLRHVIASLVKENALSLEEEETKDPCNFLPALKANAFLVLSNALATAHADGCLEEALAKHSFFVSELLPLLLAEVKNARDRASTALLSVKCLDVLSQASPEAKVKVIDSGAFDVLALAAEYGKSSHQNLATESTGLALKLQGVY